MKLAHLGVLLVLALLALPAVASSPRTEYRPYNVGVGQAAGCQGVHLYSLGGACFLLDGSESTAKVTVHDSTFNLGVPAAWALKDAADTQLSNGWFCDATSTLSIPASAARLYVWVGGPQNELAAGCTPGLATTGLVQADFT